MTRPRKILLLIVCPLLLIVAAIALLALKFAHVTDGHTPEEQRQIAEACLGILRSPLAKESLIRPDDPRLPQIIRVLRPTEITIEGNDVVIMRSGKPAEYHFSRRTGERNQWVLYVAGPGYLGHRELIRLNHE